MSILLKDFAWQYPVPIPKKTGSVFNFQSVTNEEVEEIIKSIKRAKTTGTDDLPQSHKRCC